MEKKSRIKKSAVGATLIGGLGMTGTNEAEAAAAAGVVVERAVTGKPHTGKVFVAIGASLPDVPFFSSGTCKKLMNEGYTGYLIRTSNDEMIGPGSPFQNIHSSETDTANMAKAVGFKEVFNFYYRHHRLDNRMPTDIRARMILIFRTLKVDTLITYLPADFDEADPDELITFRAAEQAALMAGIKNNYPEYQDAGLEPHAVKEFYYAVDKPWQPFNRIVDIGPTIEAKIDAITACKTQGGGSSGSALRKRLSGEGKKLAILGNDDATADREYVRNFLIASSKQLGAQHGVPYAEKFYYIDKRTPALDRSIEDFIKKNAVVG